LLQVEHQAVLKRVVSVFYILIILVIAFVLLMEIKRQYNTDVFDSLNFPFEDVYFGATKGF